MKNYFSLFFLLILFLCDPLPSFGQIQLQGFVRNYNAVLLEPEHEIITGRNRLRLDIGRSFSQGELSVSNDITNLYSAEADSFGYRLREAYADLYFPKADLRIGKQIISWGRAEGTFITDILTPVDLTDFLTQEFADLRLGITAFKYTRYFGSNYLQVVANPVFNANKIPEFNSRWFPTLPISTTLDVNILEADRQPSLKSVQLAGRYALRSNLNYDLDLGLMYWHYPTPRYAKELEFQLLEGASLNLRETYTQSVIGMYSGSYQLTDRLLLTSESAYYHRRSFDYIDPQLRNIDLQNPDLGQILQIAQIFNQNEDGFLKERPWLISMLGLQYGLGGWTFNAQLINEHIFNYDDTILQEQNFHYTTLSVRRSFLRDQLQFSAFGRYNFRGSDFWVNPEITYTGIDAFEATIGTHLFGGSSIGTYYGHTSFATYEENNFAYLRVSAYF